MSESFRARQVMSGLFLAVGSTLKSKLMWKIKSRRLRKAIHIAKAVRLDASFVLWRRLHEVLYSKPLTDGSEDTQKLTHVIARKLCGLPPVAWIGDFDSQHRQEIDEQAEKFRLHTLIKPILDQVTMGSYWAASFFTVLGDKMSPDFRRTLDDYEAVRARCHDMNPPGEAESMKIAADFARQVKEALKAEHLRTAYRFDIGLPELSQGIAILSPVLLVAGFVYCHTYYRYFGISTGTFFNLSDYLASSIEAIYAAGISAVITGIGLILNIRRDSAVQPLRRPEERGISREERPIAIAICLLLIGHIRLLVIRDPQSWLSLGAFIYVLLLTFVISQFSKLFVKPLAPIVLGLFIGGFFCTLVCDAEYNARISAAGTSDAVGREQLIGVGGHNLVGKNEMVVGASSEYFFLWSKDKRIATAMPRRDVVLVRAD